MASLLPFRLNYLRLTHWNLNRSVLFALAAAGLLALLFFVISGFTPPRL